jgi:hypothetical protein
MKAIKEHWIDIIKEYFLKEVELFLHPIQDFCLDVNWKLKKFVDKTMAHFEPDHDPPYGRITPVETIHVPFGITY